MDGPEQAAKLQKLTSTDTNPSPTDRRSYGEYLKHKVRLKYEKEMEKAKPCAWSQNLIDTFMKSGR